MKKYENISFQHQYSIKLIEDFFQKFPEEKQGRKKMNQWIWKQTRKWAKWVWVKAKNNPMYSIPVVLIIAYLIWSN